MLGEHGSRLSPRSGANHMGWNDPASQGILGKLSRIGLDLVNRRLDRLDGDLGDIGCLRVKIEANRIAVPWWWDDHPPANPAQSPGATQVQKILPAPILSGPVGWTIESHPKLIGEGIRALAEVRNNEDIAFEPKPGIVRVWDGCG